MKIKPALFLSGFILLFSLPSPSGWAAEKIRIVTTTSTFASLAQAVIGENAEIYSIAPSKQNLHFITPTPRDVLKLKKADVFVHGGLDLEVWRQPLLDTTGRSEFITGQRSIDMSSNLELLGEPIELSRIHGDIHASGNPHYWTDPLNAAKMLDTLALRLGEIYPDQADTYKKNAENYKLKLSKAFENWNSRLTPHQGTPVICYHDSWPYFFNRFGWIIAGFIEPKPGIAPTPKHLQSLIRISKEKKSRLIIREVFNESASPRRLAKETNAQVVTLAQETGEIKGDYIALIEHNVSQLEKALAQAKVS